MILLLQVAAAGCFIMYTLIRLMGCIIAQPGGDGIQFRLLQRLYICTTLYLRAGLHVDCLEATCKSGIRCRDVDIQEQLLLMMIP
jgi:hypothetical protein